MSRVGGGGYAESRGGGVGDGTGGGRSQNGRDGRTGTGANNGGGGFVSGMTGATARRTPVTSPSYEASLGNLAKLASRSIPGAGMVLGAGLDIAGARPGFTGYQGQVNTPGSYDPKGGIENSSGMVMRAPAGFPQARFQGAKNQPMPANIAKAQALAPTLHNPSPMAAQPWWRTPF